MTKAELWEGWRAAGVSYQQAQRLFKTYAATNNPESIFDPVFEMFHEYRTRYSIIYNLRFYHNATKPIL